MGFQAADGNSGLATLGVCCDFISRIAFIEVLACRPSTRVLVSVFISPLSLNGQWEIRE